MTLLYVAAIRKLETRVETGLKASFQTENS